MIRFLPGDLVWVNKNEVGILPLKADGSESGYQGQLPIAGTACTIIRHAFAKDYPSSQRRATFEPGLTFAGLAASTSWLVMIANELWLVDDGRLNKRIYTPRQTTTL